MLILISNYNLMKNELICLLIILVSLRKCCGSKYIEFGSGSRILAQFGSGSRSGVIKSVLKEKFLNNFIEKQFLLKKYLYFFMNYKNKILVKEIFTQLSL